MGCELVIFPDIILYHPRFFASYPYCQIKDMEGVLVTCQMIPLSRGISFSIFIFQLTNTIFMVD